MTWLSDRLERYSKLAGYVVPEQPGGALRLDSNENLVVPRSRQDALLAGDYDIRQYPIHGTRDLIRALSSHLRVPQDMISVGSGSDQILDMLLSHLASRRTRILMSDPTFGFFEERCRLYSIPTVRVPFSRDMTLDVSEFLDKSDAADILYLDTPNNPTGFQFPKRDLERLVERFEGMIIIDEAYGEFGDYTVLPWVRRRDNMALIRTFSKSFGLAGLRLGYMVSHRSLAGVFNRVIQYPYPLSTVTIRAGMASLSDAPQVRESIRTIKSERRRIIDSLSRYDAFEVFDSKANFVLFDARGADRRVYTALIEQGIAIRRLGRIGPHGGCLRVTVGTREMNSRFLLAIRDLLE